VVEYKKQTYAERMAAPPAVFMSPQTFGDRHSGPIMHCGEYTYAAFINAALAWAAEQPGEAGANVGAMQRAIAGSGIRPDHIETPRTGYLSGWSRYLISLYTAELREALATPRYYNVPSPDPLFTDVEVRPRVTYAHKVTIDGVRWSVHAVLDQMSEVENCYSESGAASMHGNGYDTMLVELLTKHAGLTSSGGYHSAPRYESEKWQAFRTKLEAIAELT
jgi:hypothetical protein